MLRQVAGLVALLLLFSCRSPYPDDTGMSVFRYNEASGITSLDPAFSKDLANIWPCHQLFNGLLQLDDQLNIQPSIAESWKVDDSGKQYTFHLRQDVFFHDHPVFHNGKGRRVTADDFVFSFNRILDPAVASPGAWVFSHVDTQNGSHAFSAINDSTLIIRLKEPFPPFPGILTMLYCSVVPREMINHYGPEFRKNPVGTGPFVFKFWKEGVKLVLIRNNHYFEYDKGNRLPYLDAVAITFLTDKQAAFLEFVKGNLDFISGLDQSYKDELMTKEGTMRSKYFERFNLHRQAYLNTEYLSIVVDTSLEIVKKSPLRYKEIRQAINYGFDRSKMIRYLRNNVGRPGLHGIIPYGLPGFDTTFIPYDHNPDLARELIRTAGFAKVEDVPEISLHTTAEYSDLFKYLQHELGNIGLKIRIEVIPAATLLEMKARSKINFFRASWVADYPDAENYMALFYSRNFTPQGPNYSRYSSETYDELFLRSQMTLSPEERHELYRRLNQLMMEESPVVVLYYDEVLRFTQKNIHDLGCNPMNLLSLKRAKKNIYDIPGVKRL